MIAYRQIGFRPPSIAPFRAPKIGQLTLGQERGMAVAASILDAAFAGATAWVGIYTGQKASGFLSVLGWGVGLLAALRGGIDLVSAVVAATGGGAAPARPAPQTSV